MGDLQHTHMPNSKAFNQTPHSTAADYFFGFFPAGISAFNIFLAFLAETDNESIGSLSWLMTSHGTSPGSCATDPVGRASSGISEQASFHFDQALLWTSLNLYLQSSMLSLSKHLENDLLAIWPVQALDSKWSAHVATNLKGSLPESRQCQEKTENC